MNANLSRGHKDKESFQLFASKYEEHIQNYRVEGPTSSVSNIGSRTPLQLALMISPLYLFMTRRLSAKSFHRQLVIDVAARLGPHKHPLLISVEDCIWEAIFKLADGPSSVYEVLEGLASSLPWNMINDQLNCGTEQWFALAEGMLPFNLKRMRG